MSCKDCDGCGYCLEKEFQESIDAIERDQEWRQEEADRFYSGR